MNLSDIRHIFDYTEWANALAMGAAANLPGEDLRRDVSISHQSIFGTLTHMAGAEWIWLERWQGAHPPKLTPGQCGRLESCGDLAILKQRWQEVVDRRALYISGLDEDRLDGRVAVQTAQR